MEVTKITIDPTVICHMCKKKFHVLDTDIFQIRGSIYTTCEQCTSKIVKFIEKED